MTTWRLRAAVLVLSLLGTGITAYLTVAHVAHVQVSCATGGCETVQTSRYAEIAGVPVAALGLAGYVVLAASALRRDELVRLLGFAVALAGAILGAYLVYVQAAVLDAWCQWCLASDAILLLLVPTTLLRAVRGDPPGGSASRRAPARPARARGRRGGRRPPRR